MTDEQQFMESKLTRNNPFRVPEGYFDTLTAEVMSRVPQAKPRPKAVRWLRPVLSVAAAMIALVVVSVIALDMYNHHSQELAGNAADTDCYFEEAADYMMIDNSDIYTCLAYE